MGMYYRYAHKYDHQVRVSFFGCAVVHSVDASPPSRLLTTVSHRTAVLFYNLQNPMYDVARCGFEFGII